MLMNWLDDVVRVGRIVGIGRSGKRLVMVTHRYNGKVGGLREDGRGASFPLERIGRVYDPVYQLTDSAIESAFTDIRARGREVVIPEPRLRNVDEEEQETLRIIDGQIDALLTSAANGQPDCKEIVWEAIQYAGTIRRAEERKLRLEGDVWDPFERRARVLDHFGYLNFTNEKVTDRGRWLADLHVDRPVVVGEALESGLFKSLDVITMSAVVAALAADEDRDYGELELDDSIVGSLTKFEDVGFQVSSEEWNHGIDPAPELNFSAAATAAEWARGTDWSMLVRTTRAEEGDLFRMLSRTGEALLQIASLRRAHKEAADIAAAAADVVLREPLR
jgi:hypothetical protein